MNLLSSFGNFYGNLSSDGLFFFWIVAFLFIFLIFLTIILVLKNKKLVRMLKEDNSVSEVLDDNEEEIIIAKKEEVKEEIENNKIEVKEEIEVQKYVPVEENKEKVILDVKKEETGPYKKNVLREMNARMQTSPISINNNDVTYESNEYGIDESYLREESVSPLEMMEDSFEVNDNMKFASEIVERMEEEMKPSNIELTDYERKQEEEAIISYDELLKVKDKIYNITEDEETDEFIDELKSFRLDL